MEQKRKNHALYGVIALLLLASSCYAQTTTVTGTIADANNNAYFPGTASAFIQLGTGQAPGSAIVSLGPIPTTAGGNFSMVLSSGFSYTFTFCGTPTLLPIPTVNPTPKQVCFNTIPVLLSGTSQTLTLGQIGTVAVLGPPSASTLPAFTVATLPSTALLNTVVHVTDSTSDCQHGGGTNHIFCAWNGTTWVATLSNGIPSGTAIGDLSGSYPGPNVAKVNGGSLPVSKTVVGTNASSQIVDASTATLTNPLSVVHNPASVTITGATPSVSGSNSFITNNGSATTITNFTGGVDSQPIQVNCGDANTIIANNANIATFSGTNITCFVNQAYQFAFYSSISKWVQVGGGSGTPGGAPVQAQFNSSGTFGGSSCANLPTIASTSINFDCDTHPKGLNPYLDVTRYGVRACQLNAAPCIAGVTSTTVATNPVITVSAADFVVGDGISLYAVGAAHSMTTPAAPTVTPSVNNVLTGTRMVSAGPAGSTTYTYEIFAENKSGGITAASAAGTTTTGQATLGSNSANITSCTRSGTTVTCTTASPHGYTVGATGQSILIGSTSDSTFLGWWSTSAVPDSTHFSFIGNQNTNNGATTTTTGGSVVWWNCNHVTWTRVTGAYRYWILGRIGGSLTTIGYSWPENPLSTGLSGSPITEGVNSWDDFGSTMMGNLTLPPWIPGTAPSAAQANTLTTTVTAIGGGGTSLTLATAPSFSASGVATVLDSTPGIIAAQAAGFGTGGSGLPLYFPATQNNRTVGYPVNSFLDLTTNFSTAFIVNGTIQLNDTAAFTNASKITGYYDTAATASSFSFDSLPIIYVNGAYPGIHMQAAGFRLEGVSVQAPASANNALLVVQDFGGANPGVFYKRTEFTTGAGNDYMGIGLLARGVPGTLSAQLTLEQVLALPGGPTTGGTTATPIILCADCAILNIKQVQAAHRGLYVGVDTTGGGAEVDTIYFQSSITPALSFASADGNSFAPSNSNIVFNGNATMDTSGSPLLWFGPGIGSMNLFLEHAGVSALGTNTITGNAISLISGRSPLATQALGATWNTVGPANNCTTDGFYSAPGACTFLATFYSTMPIGVAASSAVFIDQVAIPAPVATLAAGGSVAIGAHSYQIIPVWQNSGTGRASLVSNTITTTTGNQTINITWTPQIGCLGYEVVRDGFVLFVAGNYLHGCATSSFSDTGSSATGGFNITPGGGPTELLPGTQGIASGGPVYGASFSMYSGNVLGSLSPATLTAARGYTFPDASGNVCVANANCLANTSQTAYDTFNRANNPIATGAPVTWVTNAVASTWNVSSNTAIPSGAGVHNMNVVTSPVLNNDQFAQAVVVTQAGPAGIVVRGSTSQITDYECIDSLGGGQQIARELNNTFTTLVSVGSPVGVSGDLVRCEVQGSVAPYTIRMYVNDALVLTTTDSSIASGSPGLRVFSTGAVIDNFSAGNINLPIAQLNLEQDWTQPQHFTGPVTIGTPAPVAGALAGNSLIIGAGAVADFQGVTSAPANPPLGFCREYFNSTTGFIQAINSSGATCSAAISGMTTGQVAIAGGASSITSSKPITGTGANIMSSGTVSGNSAALCTDSGGGLSATTVGCTGGAISGMTTGQVAIAGSASSITSSKALQGTDTNVLTSSVIAAGTGNPLCTDTGSGATTTCPTLATTVFNTQSATTNSNIVATNMVASASALHSYQFSWTISLTAVGVGCSSSTTINMNAIFTDPNSSTTTTELLGIITIAAGGNGTVGFIAQGTDNILAKSGTAVQYSTSGYTAGTGCTTNPTYQVSPTLSQLW